VKDGSTGLLVAPGRADELADALERLAASGELRERLGRHGRLRVEREFDVDAAAARLADLFERTVPGTTTGLPPPAHDEREPAAAAA
jgi:mannosyltransferase